MKPTNPAATELTAIAAWARSERGRFTVLYREYLRVSRTKTLRQQFDSWFSPSNPHEPRIAAYLWLCQAYQNLKG